MQQDYLWETSRKTIAPLFSPDTTSTFFKSNLLASAIFLGFWPFSSLPSYIHQESPPLIFLAVLTSVLFITSYINLRAGKGEVLPHDSYSRLKIESENTLDESLNYLTYGLPAAAAYSIFSIILFLPQILFSAGLSGLNTLDLAIGLAVILCSAFIFRLTGFFFYMIFGRFNQLGHLISRLTLAFLLLGTAWIKPEINPVLIIYNISHGKTGQGGPGINLLLAFYAILILLLILINQTLVRRRISHSLENIQ